MTKSLYGEIGDVIEVQATHVGQPRRLGEILEVLGSPGHEHYRVRWEDARETLFFPTGQAVVVRRAGRDPSRPQA